MHSTKEKALDTANIKGHKDINNSASNSSSNQSVFHQSELIKRLQQDYKLKHKGDYLREGVCPECGKKELFISTKEPHYLKCGRESKCNWGMKTRDLYPDLWKPLHEQFPPTKLDPNATARAYLRMRGLDPDLFKQEFIQSQRWEREAIREPKGTETVRFFLTKDKTVWWERFITVIDTPEKPKKAHFQGSYKGLWWQPSGFLPETDDRVFLVEGILDALSLLQSGFKAVSLMSSNNWPETSLKPYLGKNIRWVLALDNDTAGQRYNLKYYHELSKLGEKVEVCIAPDKEKRDWNDLLKTSNGKINLEDLKEWFYTGKLLTASNARAKALLIVEHTQKHRFTFDYGNQLYAAKYSERDEDEPIQIESIANCKPDFLYFQKDKTTGDGFYFMRITRPGLNKPYMDVFAPSALSSAGEFKNRLMNVGAGLMFTGNTKQLERHQQDYWFNKNQLPEVDTINFIGYAQELKAWVFPGQAVSNGVLYLVNQDDFFDLPDGRQIKTSFRQDTVTIGRIEDAHQPQLWINDFKTAFKAKGLATLAYWAGSFFAEQIRDKQASYPFLELSGEPGTGKTTLLEFLWKLSGRKNYEGIELSKASHAGRWRSLEQLANLPLVLIEGDRSETGHQKRTFDLNEAKGLYNGRGMRAVGVRTGGSETREPPFRGALVIAQNAPVESERAVMERIIRIPWDKNHFSREGYAATNRLRILEMENINGFMTACITKEKVFLEKYGQGYNAAMQKLERHNTLGNQRIRHNHAQIMGLAHALKATGILTNLLASDLEELDTYLTQCCLERHQCLEADSPLITEFWEMYHYLENETNERVNHSKDPSKIAISLNQFANAMAEMKQRPFDLVELRRELKTSKRYPFMEYVTIWSTITAKSIKCFVFSSKEGTGQNQAA